MLKYFGTDGIRGIVNQNLTFQLAYNVGKSLAIYISKHKKSETVIIGKDTRISGDMLTYAVACGLSDYGVNSKIIGIVPTGCVSYLSSKLDVGAGVMITASHNAPNMNGIKLINNLGYKFCVDDEIEIERYIDKKITPKVKKGKIVNALDLVDKYINFLCNDVGCDLNGVNIAVDTAYGSNYAIAEKVFKKLNANLVLINNDPLGEKINVNCGALNVKHLTQEVIRHKCQFGFAFDGDADRLIVVLSDGRALNGDDILFVLGGYMLKKNKLNSLTVVGTIMTNSGTEESFKNIGVRLVRTDVGDRNVIEKMMQNNYVLGGESSGHICVASLNTTCDAILNALYLLKIVITENIDLNELLLHLKKAKQTIVNVKVSDNFRHSFDTNIQLKKSIASIEKQYPDIRIVVRPSGTESLIRIMVEGDELKSNVVVEKIKQLLV
ncbi:MAG: phosphoglucosamine mutase [Firmicutes bacterium]|nr:phosphoglucosamine mutase [Bacillota bacterium]